MSILQLLKMSVNSASTECQQSINTASIECQQSVNNFGCCILYNPRAVLLHLPIIEVLPAFIGNIVCIDTATPQTERQYSVNRASTERQQSINRASTERQQRINTASIECQQSVNDFGCCFFNNPRALVWHIPRINILTAIMSKSDRDIVISTVWKWASTECQRLSVLHLV